MLKSFEASTSVGRRRRGGGVDRGPVGAQTERSGGQAERCPQPFWRTMFRVPYLAGAAALAAVLVLGISLYHGSPEGPGKIGGGTYGKSPFRSGAIHLVSPVGDLAQAPAEFRWDAVSGASSYPVELKDVAGMTLASAKSTQNVLPVTPEMKANMSSGKPLSWKVTALDAAGNAVADSSGESFKIK